MRKLNIMRKLRNFKHKLSVSIFRLRYSKVTFRILWYDFYIGIYFDMKNRKDQNIYVIPLPMCVIKIDLPTYYDAVRKQNKTFQSSTTI